MKILFVTVLYNQKYWDCKTYLTLLSKIKNGKIFIFDNSPQPQHSAQEFDGASITYVSNTSNPGLSFAYNRAAEYAQSEGLDWIIILDQDTAFEPVMIDEFEAAFLQYPAIKLFVPAVRVSDELYMSPTRNSYYRHGLLKTIPRGVVSTQEYISINSGMILSVDALFEVGGYNEKVWLDHSDYQFMKRFNRKYSQMYVLNSECMQDFSCIVQTSKQKLKRFEIFCDCIKNCEKYNIKDKIGYLYIVVKRTISLIVATRSLKPIKTLINKYFI